MTGNEIIDGFLLWIGLWTFVFAAGAFIIAGVNSLGD